MSPAGFYGKFRRNVEVADFVSERRTLGVVRTLSGRVDRLVERATTTGKLVALYGPATSTTRPARRCGSSPGSTSPGTRLDRYVDTASRLGSRDWAPIVAMAESATVARHQSLAVDVFVAADRPGPQQGHLRRRCHDLTDVDLSDKPHPRAVPGTE